MPLFNNNNKTRILTAFKSQGKNSNPSLIERKKVQHPHIHRSSRKYRSSQDIIVVASLILEHFFKVEVFKHL